MKSRNTRHSKHNRTAMLCTAVLLAAIAVIPAQGAYAKYKAEATTKAEVHFKTEFTVSFDYNGMFPSSSQNVSYGNSVNLPNLSLYSVQTISYYKNGSVQSRYAVAGNEGTRMFAGWFKDAECTIPYDQNAPVTDDITIYAKWSPVYAVSFDMNGHGPAQNTVYMDKGTSYMLPVDTWSSDVTDIIGSNKAFTDEADGKRYVFTGWLGSDGNEISGDSVIITGNTQFVAGWANVYSVSFDTDGKGTAPAAQNVVSGCQAQEPEAPAAEGFYFSGWRTDPAAEELYSFETPVTGDLTLHAVWNSNPVVSFNLMGYGEEIPSQSVPFGGTAVKPADPVADHQRFDGWFVDPGESAAFDFTIPVTGNITAYAHWTQLYDVAYDMGGIGQSIPGYLAAAGDAVVNPGDQTAEGYSFLGWYTAADSDVAFDFTVPVSGNTTVYARWIKVHAVSFDMGGIGTQVEPQLVLDGEYATDPGPQTAEGYQFLAWYRDADFTVPALFELLPITEDTIFYANWLQNTPPVTHSTYTLKFEMQLDEAANAALAAAFPPITQEDNTSFTLPVPVPEYEGYTFRGWATQPKAAFDESGMPYTPEYLWDAPTQSYLAAWNYSPNPVIQVSLAETTLYAVWRQNP